MIPQELGHWIIFKLGSSFLLNLPLPPLIYYMSKIIDYTTVRNMDPAEFEKEIKTLMDKNWQPFGSIAVTVVHYNERGLVSNMPDALPRLVFIQAMVKYVSVKVSDVKVVD
jgi:hypothetical protein